MLKLFGLGKKESEPQAASSTASPEAGLSKLASALAVTSQNVIGSILSLGKAHDAPLSDEDYEQIEDTLIRADIGVDLAVSLTERLRKNKAISTSEQLLITLQQEFEAILSAPPEPNTLRFEAGRLNIYLVVGVNGAGKTTLIGKLAHRFVQQGKTVSIAAGDTFRAAAEEQLEVWAERAGAKFISKDTDDAAAVVFEAVRDAVSAQTDILIIDTAGRLQNKFNLMEELRKINRILEKELPEQSIRETLLVVDANTGQNGLQQAKVFHEAVGLTGVALTKLDGSAKGGIIFQIADQLRLPVKLVGVGEKIDDLRDFDRAEFITALFQGR